MSSSLPATDLVRAALHVAERELTVGHLLRLGASVGLAPGTVRVALTRLVKRGHVETPRRGVYAHSARARSVDALIRGWRTGEARACTWTGGYLLALGVREPTRPLRWLGFAATPDGLVVRPDNLALDRDALEARARELGAQVELAQLSGLSPARWRAAWDTDALNAGYAARIEELERSLTALPRRERGAALIETLRLGHDAIRQVALDPLLPEAWLDPALRARLSALTLDYDDAGRALWAASLADAQEAA